MKEDNHTSNDQPSPSKPELVLNEDYYINDLGQWVFTAAYHLKRGYCCNNGCKHCPYRIEDAL